MGDRRRDTHTVPVQQDRRAGLGRGGRALGVAVVAAALLLSAAPLAGADETGEPPAPSVSPTPTPPDVAPVPSPSPPGPGSAGASPTVSTPSTSPAPRPAGGPGGPAGVPGRPNDLPDRHPDTGAPQPGTDGVLPDFGVSDAYWDTFRELQQRQDQVVAAQAVVEDARAAVTAATAQRDALVATWDASEISARASRLELDRLASHLYQFGTPVTAVTAMLGAPDDFLSQVDSQHNEELAATFVVSQATSDDARAALARAVALAAGTRLQAAELTAATAQQRLAVAQRDLERTTERLDGLAGSAPQTQVGPDGCPRTDVPDTLRGGAETVGARRLCRAAVAAAATPEAALAITWAFAHLGSAYACGGAGRMLDWRMDCSSLVARAYHEGAGLATAGDTWAPSTRDMVPWGGAGLDPHYAQVAPARVRPGDLVLYDTGGATYRHVVIYLGPAGTGRMHWMLHTNSCGDVAKIEPFWGFPSTGSHTFLVARRVLRLPTDPPPLKTPHRSG